MNDHEWPKPSASRLVAEGWLVGVMCGMLFGAGCQAQLSRKWGEFQTRPETGERILVIDFGKRQEGT